MKRRELRTVRVGGRGFFFTREGRQGNVLRKTRFLFRPPRPALHSDDAPRFDDDSCDHWATIGLVDIAFKANHLHWHVLIAFFNFPDFFQATKPDAGGPS